MLGFCEYEQVPNPSKEEVKRYPHLICDPNDIPVALSAINVQVDYLVTRDKDFTDPDASIHEYLNIILPGTFLREHMGWASKQLEEIRGRNWD
jgi:hypothetical protein